MDRGAHSQAQNAMTDWRPLAYRLVVRGAVGAGMLVLLFALRWRFGGTHFDFQAFRAAEALASKGNNPYDLDALNGELRTNVEDYSDFWANDSTGNFRMFFFNPPIWLVQLRMFATSPAIMSALGGAAMVVSMVWLSLRDTTVRAAGYGVGAFFFLALGMADTTMWFGQTGLLLAGIVGVYLSVEGSRVAGVPIAFLAFKPHLSLALGIRSLTDKPFRTAVLVGVPLLALVALSMAMYSPGLWLDWVRGLTSDDRTVVDNDFTIRTLSPRHPLPEWSSWPLLVMALIASAGVSIRYRFASSAIVTLFAMGLTAFLSGHAFAHDYLWLVFVPILGKWSPKVTVTAALLATMPRWSGRPFVLWDLLDLSSLVALGAVATLFWMMRTSDRDRRPGPAGSDSDDVLSGEPSVDREDRAGRKHRLAAG